MWQRNRDFDFHKLLGGYKNLKKQPSMLPMILDVEEVKKPEPLTYLEKLQIREEQIKHENFLFGQKLLKTRSKLDTWQKNAEGIKENEERKVERVEKQNNEKDKRSKKSIFPEVDIMRKYYFNARNDLIMKYNPFHPKVFIELECKGDGEPLGRITFQLYTESCPDVVEQFLQVFMQRAKYKLSFGKLYPMCWLEGDIKLNALKTLKKKCLDCNKKVMENCSDKGLLSFSDKFLTEFNSGKLTFSINFKPMNEINKKQVVFGRAVMGLRLVEMLSHFGNNSGAPHKPIIVKNIGVEK